MYVFCKSTVWWLQIWRVCQSTRCATMLGCPRFLTGSVCVFFRKIWVALFSFLCFLEVTYLLAKIFLMDEFLNLRIFILGLEGNMSHKIQHISFILKLKSFLRSNWWYSFISFKNYPERIFLHENSEKHKKRKRRTKIFEKSLYLIIITGKEKTLYRCLKVILHKSNMLQNTC